MMRQMATLLASAALLTAIPAHAHASPEFRAACIAAHRNPYAPTGQLCRSQGWTVRKHIVTTPRRVIVYDSLPACTFEDGGPYPCIWYGQVRGNRDGLTYYMTRSDHPHYRWASRPTVNGWHWLPPVLVHRFRHRHPREHWHACVTRGEEFKVRCPDGWWSTD